MRVFPFIPLLLLCLCVFVVGCSLLFSGQEWSDNYALLDGTKSTSSKAFDGNMETVGHAKRVKKNRAVRSGPAELVVILPEKKVIRKIVIHSDNLKKFRLYVDIGGTLLKDTDWKLIVEEQSVKKGVAVVPISYLHATDKVKLVPVGTTAIREMEIYGYKTAKNIKDEPIIEDDPIAEKEEKITDQFEPLLY